MVEQGLPSRKPGDHHAGGGGMVDAGRQRREVACLHRHVLR